MIETPEEYNKYHAWRSHYTGMEYSSIQSFKTLITKILIILHAKE